jgi:Ran GTPase-activating protein (RanGAP) involved in mRNA processing and transport
MMPNAKKASRNTLVPLRFGLRTLLAGVTLVCILLAYGPYRAREYQQRKGHARQLIANLGGRIEYAGFSRTPSPGSNWLSRQLGYVEYPENLWKVVLVGTSATAKDLANLADCEWIRAVDLSNTNVSDEAIEPLIHLAKLRAVRLANTHVTDAGITKLIALEHLIMLDVSGTAVTYDSLAELDQHFSGSHFQEQLAVSRCQNARFQVTTIPRFQTELLNRLFPLESFSPPTVDVADAININRPIALTKNEIEDIRHLTSAIHFISGAGAFTHGMLQFLADLPNLETVMICGNPKTQLSDADVQLIAKLPRLRFLMLADHNSQITDQGIAALANARHLESLDLNAGGVTDAAFVPLARALKLKQLFLHGVGLTDEGLAALADDDELECLSVNGNHFTPALIEHLRGLPKLHRLDLYFLHKNSGSDPYGRPPDELVAAARDGVNSLTAIPNLQELTIVGNLMTAEAIEPVEQLSGLVHLGIDRKYVGSEAFEHMQQALPNCVIEEIHYSQ